MQTYKFRCLISIIGIVRAKFHYEKAYCDAAMAGIVTKNKKKDEKNGKKSGKVIGTGEEYETKG